MQLESIQHQEINKKTTFKTDGISTLRNVLPIYEHKTKQEQFKRR